MTPCMLLLCRPEPSSMRSPPRSEGVRISSDDPENSSTTSTLSAGWGSASAASTGAQDNPPAIHAVESTRIQFNCSNIKSVTLLALRHWVKAKRSIFSLLPLSLAGTDGTE